MFLVFSVVFSGSQACGTQRNPEKFSWDLRRAKLNIYQSGYLWIRSLLSIDVRAQDCERLLAEVHEMRRSTPSIGQLHLFLQHFPPCYGEYLGIPMGDVELSAVDIIACLDRITESEGAVVPAARCSLQMFRM